MYTLVTSDTVIHVYIVKDGWTKYTYIPNPQQPHQHMLKYKVHMDISVVCVHILYSTIR